MRRKISQVFLNASHRKKFENHCSKQLPLVELHSLLCLCFSWMSLTIQHCELFSFGPLLCQRSVSTSANAAFPYHTRLQTSYLPFAPFMTPLSTPLHHLMFLAVFLHLQLSLPLLTRSGYLNGMPEAFQPQALNFSTLSRSIL